MIDVTSHKGRIVQAALRLAGERPWTDVSLLDIAEAAGLKLADLRAQFSSKGEILAHFARSVDDDMLRRTPPRQQGQAPRDQLFEVVMSRLDALAPYRTALRSIADGGGLDPALVRSFLSSQHWMLQAAGIGTDGIGGGLRLAGLASVYASVMRTWLDDDDPGLARTMAALDRRLRSGERTLRLLDDALGFAERMASAVSPLGRGWRATRDRATDAGSAPGSSTTSGGMGGPSTM